jgi:hypothetical protein
LLLAEHQGATSSISITHGNPFRPAALTDAHTASISCSFLGWMIVVRPFLIRESMTWLVGTRYCCRMGSKFRAVKPSTIRMGRRLALASSHACAKARVVFPVLTSPQYPLTVASELVIGIPEGQEIVDMPRQRGDLRDHQMVKLIRLSSGVLFA